MLTLVEFLVRHGRLVAVMAAALALGLILLGGAPGVDNSLEVWFVENDPALVAYRDFLETFGNDEVVVTALTPTAPEPKGLEPARLGVLLDLTRRLQRIDGVARVHSLAATRAPDGHGGTAPLIDQPVDEADARRCRRALAGSRMASRLAGQDGATLVLYTWLDATPDIDVERPRIIDAIRAAAESAVAGAGEQVSHAGMGVMYDALNRATFDEGATFIGLSYLAVAAALLVVTGRVVWTLLALVCIGLADTALFGVIALARQPLNAITMALPALVMILGVSNTVHLSRAVEEAQTGGRRPRGTLPGLLAAVALPCLFNALTTACGFASLGSASMAITRSYGLFAAVGVILAFAFALVGMAAAGPAVRARGRPTGLSAALPGAVVAVMLWSLRRPGPVLAAAAVGACVAALGAGRIVVDTFSMDFLPLDHRYRHESARIEEGVGPYVPVELTIAVSGPDEWARAGFLRQLAEVQASLAERPGMGRPASILDVLHDVAVAAGTGPQPTGWAPRTDEEAAAIVRAARAGAGPAPLAEWVADGGRVLRLTVPVPMASARDMVTQAREIRDVVAEGLAGEKVVREVAMAGYLPLYGRMIVHLVRDQVTSFSLAFAGVFLLVMLILRSGRLTLAAVAPNLLPVGVILGTMGLAGIRLDIATVTIAAAILGIVVDDTIHLLYSLRLRLSEGCDLETALGRVARTSGAAIVSSSLILCAGFGVLAACGVRSVSYVGLLTAVGVASALVTDLVLLPAILALLYRKQRENGLAPDPPPTRTPASP